MGRIHVTTNHELKESSKFHELSQSSENDPPKESFKHHELNESSTTTKSKSFLHISNSMGRTHVTVYHELKEPSKFHELS